MRGRITFGRPQGLEESLRIVRHVLIAIAALAASLLMLAKGAHGF